MGIVIRQSLLSSAASYLGVAIGFVNAVILMPKFMTPDQIGLFRTLLSAALLLSNLGRFGINSGLVRFKSLLKNPHKELKSLYGLGVLIVFLSTLFFLIILIVFRSSWADFYAEKAPEVNNYFILLIILTLELIVFQFLQTLASINKNIFAANLLKDLVYKSLNMGGILLFAASIISFHTFIILHVGFYIILIGLLFIESIYKYKIKISFKPLSSQITRELIYYCATLFISGLGLSILNLADQQLVSRYLGLEANGIYMTAIFMVMVIDMPRRFVGEISAPIISEAFGTNNLTSINEHYKKASVNLFLLGGLIYLLIIVNLDNIYAIMPKGHIYEAGRNVVILVGLAKLINLLFSLNDGIISMSKYYRFNMILTLFLGLLMICSDVILIPQYGLIGAASALLIVFTLHGLFKLILLKMTYNFFPFTSKTILVALTILGLLLINCFISPLINPFIDLLVRSGLIVMIFSFLIYKLKLSFEIHQMINNLAKRLNINI